MFQHDRPDIRFIDATLIDRFLAPEHRDTHTFEAYDQRAVVLIVLWILACGVWFVPLYGFLLDAWPSAIAVALCCSAVFGGLFTLRWTGTTLWSCNITCLALTAILTWLSLRTGGIASAPAFWLLLVPVSAHALYHNRHFTVGWAVAALAALGFIYTVKRLDGSFSVLSNAENDLLFLAGTIGLLFAVLQIVNIRNGFERWLYESVRRREVARREAEAELRRANEESRERARQSLRALIENSPDAIIVHQSGQIIYTNAAARELVGYSEDELHQMTVEDLVDEAELERVRERVASLRDASALPLREMEVVRKDGTRVAVEATAFKGTFDGDEAVLSTLRDLTERRALRAKMMQLDRMIAVGTLATGVAHEINNPLSFVRSNLEFLSTRLVGEEEADQDESDQ
ncbi:MAG: PAS domain S-box protein, partial [Persicimonas sp.]